VLGAPAVLPLLFMTPAVLRLSPVTHEAGNDVLGTGGALLLFATLAITPAVTITGRRWFAPLRRWYGILFAADVILDAVLAVNDPTFGRSPQQDLTGHTFLLAGLIMVLISVPLLATAWRPAMRGLGRWWKPVQKTGTYAIWVILAGHLMLLEGFGVSHRDAIGPDHAPFDFFHQRFYEYLACTIPLIVFRLPAVRRSQRARDLLTVPCLILFTAGYLFLVNELLYKGIAAFRLNPVND
jgi:DMSO/TMAO reductase YedYZ heme-binding membrane subunit